MKKIDFHIHTVPTHSDSLFEFDIEKIKDYVSETRLDAIAITNHDIFDLAQYKEIKKQLNIPVFPGIEINIETGHLLLISEIKDLEIFFSKCTEINKRIKTPEDFISVEELMVIFSNLNEYLLIPHYQKKPEVSEEILKKLNDYIVAGEVNSPKKFLYCKKNYGDLTPVIFSDCRIASRMEKFSTRQTFLNCGEITLATIKFCLSDKNKVHLSPKEGQSLFQILENGQNISTGLNVIVGGRSSGKTHMLDHLYDNDKYCKVKYIRQFSLIERSDEKDKQRFDSMLSHDHSKVTVGFLKEFQKVVYDAGQIDLERNSRAVKEYIESLIKFAKESERNDAFSKANLYSEQIFEILNQKELKKLIDSVEHLIENVDFRETINKHIPIQNLKSLIVELMNEYSIRKEDLLKKIFLNEIISEIKESLQLRSAATTINDVDLYKVAVENEKVEKFNQVSKLLRKDRVIMKKNIQGYSVIAKSGEFTKVKELKDISKSNSIFSEAFKEYERPFNFLNELKKIEGLPEADYFKYFVNIRYYILNKDENEVSGGERSEFNLLQEINDAKQFDMLLIDEPESSFDNIFLNSNVNEIIKEIAKSTPVVLVTHNSTIGASIKPDYLIYTKKETILGNPEYHIYSGFPTDKELKSVDGKSVNNHEATLNCLEAGEAAYNERRINYENLKN